MSLITWTDKMSVGIAKIDKEHQGLVEMLNTLHGEMLAGRGKDVLGPTLGKLIQYTQTHFAGEELLFRIHAYPQAADHKKEHDAFTAKAKALEVDFKSGKAAITSDLMNFLRDWLTKHILGADMQYKPYFAQKGLK
jgi:hemerythrin-like metal-binding protein